MYIQQIFEGCYHISGIRACDECGRADPRNHIRLFQDLPVVKQVRTLYQQFPIRLRNHLSNLSLNNEQKDEIISEKYGAIVVATGFDTINLDKYDEYAYSQSTNLSLNIVHSILLDGPSVELVEVLARSTHVDIENGHIHVRIFIPEAHAKLRPVESPTAGIFLSGVCQGPKDIPETVAQAGADGHATVHAPQPWQSALLTAATRRVSRIPWSLTSLSS